jgi:protoporphyrinogen oxidase
MNNQSKKTAVIIGAGPAGLTAALELLRHTDIKPILLEKSEDIGGISKTVNYKGNRIDIGGHRFFSKSDTVMQWWQDIFPFVDSPEGIAKNQSWQTEVDEVFLQRERLSRIYYLRKFFDYPVTLNKNTILNLGFVRIINIGFSYLRYRIFPIRSEKHLEDFFINRFGKVLYKTFFRDYTEKVWGKPCTELSPEWGAQRIKGLSVSKVIAHYIKSFFKGKKKDIQQKDAETSLIGWFLYPKYGPGQFWEHVAKLIEAKGGEILFHTEFNALEILDNGKFNLEYFNAKLNTQVALSNIDFVFSTTTVNHLVSSILNVPTPVLEIASGLMHRNFITVGLLVNKLLLKNKTAIKTYNNLIPDNWIYVQESEVMMGRIQVFNNWSPFMVSDVNNVWLGLEYFCNAKDEFWKYSDEKLIDLAKSELALIDIINANDVLDATVVRMEHTYPVYFGTYEHFNQVQAYLDSIPNLFPIGRNGMHRYNNSDHSMLTAITAVQNIISGRIDKRNIWNVNTEQDYHEEKDME